MGLGDFFESINPAKAITRALGISDSIAPVLNLAFTPFLATQLAGKAVGAVLGTVGEGRAQSHLLQQSYYAAPPAPQPVPRSYVVQGPSFSGSYLDTTGGLPPWDYSTYSAGPTVPAYSVERWAPPLMPSVSAPGDRIWEDLALLAPAFL
jgi:hypothetical protein